VCEKYGLVIGKPHNYTGEIPSWALALIEKNRHLIHEWEEPTFNFDSFMIPMWSLPRPRLSFGADGALGWGMSAPETPEIKEPAPTAKRNNLHIVAPATEMKLGFNERVVGNKIEEVKDPIVCLKVEGGYVVLAAWGEEGSDPRVFNALSN
jgi:hypothetical protein